MSNARPPSPRSSLVAPEAVDAFEEIELSFDGGVTQLRHAAESSYGQLVVLCGSTFLFVLFVVSVMPLMRLPLLGNAVWVVVGLALLATIGLVTQARLRVTTLRMGDAGVELWQGTSTDHEQATIAWGELTAVELEPVDPKDGRKGMLLRLTPRGGAEGGGRADGHAHALDAFAGLGLHDLNAARRAVLAEWQPRRGRTSVPTSRRPAAG